MIAAIIQARMGSTRLPGKVLKKAEGKTLLEHVVERVGRAKTLDKIIIATTESPNDDAIVDEAKKLGAEVFRGSEEDVLGRFCGAARKFSAKHVVRLTADCPLMDPEVVDEAVNFYLRSPEKYDYVCNVNPPTYPWGMDVEVFSTKALEKAQKETKLPHEREHVTPYIRNHPEIFNIGNIEYKENFANLRLTVDGPEDLAVVGGVFNELYPKNKHFKLADILNLYGQKPGIFSANSHIKRI